MGFVKQMQLAHHEKVRQTAELCIECGAITECPIHQGEYIDTLEYSDPEELTTAILEYYPDARQKYSDRAEMVDCVKEVLAFSGEESGYCSKNREQ